MITFKDLIKEKLDSEWTGMSHEDMPANDFINFIEELMTLTKRETIEECKVHLDRNFQLSLNQLDSLETLNTNSLNIDLI